MDKRHTMGGHDGVKIPGHSSEIFFAGNSSRHKSFAATFHPNINVTTAQDITGSTYQNFNKEKEIQKELKKYHNPDITTQNYLPLFEK
jgi:hypothetical protein